METTYQSAPQGSATAGLNGSGAYASPAGDARTAVTPAGRVPYALGRATPLEPSMLPGARGEPSTLVTPELEQYERQLEYLRRERDALRDQLEAHEAERTWLTAQAAGDDVALFILTKVVEAEILPLGTLTENLTAPYGWLAFAQLMRARLVDCQGHSVVPTDAGVELVSLMRRAAKEG